ncbi:hypothetical protein ACHAWF_009186 [Thalassiosira exigua]
MARRRPIPSPGAPIVRGGEEATTRRGRNERDEGGGSGRRPRTLRPPPRSVPARALPALPGPRPVPIRAPLELARARCVAPTGDRTGLSHDRFGGVVPSPGESRHRTTEIRPRGDASRSGLGASGATGVGGVHRPLVLPSPGGVPVLPGFFDARDVIPGYPFVGGFASGSRGNDSTEAVFLAQFCQQGLLWAVDPGKTSQFSDASPAHRSALSASPEADDPASAAVDEIPSPDGSEPGSLSVPLLAGLDTIGVLVVWPCRLPSAVETGEDGAAPSSSWSWTPDDKRRAALAAKSLALALSMDGEAASARLADERFRVAVADGLHQVKSPLQALRTFGKLLQRQLAEGDEAATVERMTGRATGTGMDGLRNRRSALRLAEDMIAQGERVADLVEPMDALVGQEGGRFLLRGDVDGDDGPPPSGGALVLRPTDPSRIGDPKFQLPPSMPIPDDSPPEMVFPQDTLGSIVYASQAMSRERGINFDAVGFEPDNEISGVLVQPKHLEEAVSNVLDNAIKYAPCRRKGKVGRSRTPRIKVSLTSNEPPLRPGATIVVEDNGPGIPESQRDKVFERGYRCDGTMREQVGGSGLGLAIAREMISRMGGTMDILDEGPDKMDGTAVRVVLFRDPELR